MVKGSRKTESGLGATVRAARKARGLGLRDLAVTVGMSPSSLSEFENGKSTPSRVRLEALAAALEVELVEAAPERDDISFVSWREFDPVPLDPVRNAALEVFVEFGYYGATMRMIADRSGMSVAGVYHHIRSKDEVLAWLIERSMTELFARCAAADAEVVDPRRRLSQLVECLVLFHVHRRPWAFLAASEGRSLDDEHRDRLFEGRRRVRRLIQDALASYVGVESTVVPEESIARAIATMCVGVADWYGAAGSPDPSKLADEFVTLALAMATAEPRTLVPSGVSD